ncbi:MAG TPA: glycosyltransferase family 4 protein [Lachnospiraceae bacterium]|nr:glycosyltransferase family 4 protein [Lachnospiraceae bacterium]
MQIVFVSNYINHHQLPMSKAIQEENVGEYWFIQTEEMDPERVAMGWAINFEDYPFVKCYTREPELCKKLILESDAVIFGGVEDESYIETRLALGKLTIRYSERIYKEGQWKFISPRGLLKKYHDHIRYRNKNVYLLCAGAYVASDFHLIHAYPNKMFTWGYFPQFEEYRVDEIMEWKRQRKGCNLLWAGRMIDWKHPKDVIPVLQSIKNCEEKIHLTMIGEGECREEIVASVKELGLEEVVTFTGFLPPAKVREYMKQSDVFLFTSDFKEGWGAVLNEAMNSGCAVVASSGIGAVPYLLEHGKNGMVYRNGDVEELARYTRQLVEDEKFRELLGVNAYETIRSRWNANNAAKGLVRMIRSALAENPEAMPIGPMSKASLISPRRGYEYTRRS